MKKIITTSALFFLSIITSLSFGEGWAEDGGLFAQNIGINGSGAYAHSSALLDVDAASTPSLGILIPRIALQAINVAAPVNAPATSLLVYNTASASTGSNAVSAGYYYWDGAKWVRFAYNASGNSANDWSTLGNAGTVAGTNFLGTTDDVDLVFKRNNVQAGLINLTNGNTSFGLSALNPLTTGLYNTAVGTLALAANTLGNKNTAIGQQALLSNTSGSQNTGVGLNSLHDNTTGSKNVAIGVSASYSNTTGSQNTAFGFSALLSNTTGSVNVAVGTNALYNNTTGIENEAFGYQAMYANTIGIGNAAFGDFALYSNISGGNNTALGSQALQSNLASDNSAVGDYALQANTIGNSNVAVGNFALHTNVSGNKNTAVGMFAGATTTTSSFGNGNTFIGYFSDATAGTFTNATAIGYNAKVGASNALILGGTGADAVNVGINTTTPVAKLDVYGGIKQSGNNVIAGQGTYINWNDNTTTTFNGETINQGKTHFINHRGTGTGGFEFDFYNFANTFSFTPMVITANGNVGIGTIAPNSKLRIEGASSNTNGLQIYTTLDYATDLSPGTSYSGAYCTLTGVPSASLTIPAYIQSVVGELKITATDRTYGILGAKSNNGSGSIINSGVFGSIEGQTTAQEPVVAGGRFVNPNNIASHWAIHVSGRSFQTTGVWTASDRAFKKNITPLENSLADVSKLNLYSYNFNTEHKDAQTLGLVACPEKQYGVLAQELEIVFPDMVTTDGYGNKLVKYEALIPVALRAIQEQQAKIEQLEKKIEALEKK